MDLAIKARSPLDYESTLRAVTEQLATEGFGVLSEIDVAAKMKEKLDKQMPPYKILGACAPPLAWKALGAVKDLGVLLPCNVCVYDDEDGQTWISAMEPQAALSLIDDEQVAEVAREASARLHRVVQATVEAA